MKNTTFRKKALLSSVAMLLVALVALGSATFAWFTSNPNADATGLKLKTTAASGLVIRTTTDPNWSHNALLDAVDDTADNGTKVVPNPDVRDFQPVSQNQDDGTFVTTAAKVSGEYGRDTGDVSTGKPAAAITTAQTGMYYSERVYFRLSDGSKAEDDVTINLTGVSIDVADGATMGGCIRVAVAKPNGEVIATYATEESSENGVLTTTGEDEWTKFGLVGDQKTDAVYTGALSTESAQDKAPYVVVYVYLDGQDTNCFSDRVGDVNSKLIIDGVTVDFGLVINND